MIKNKHFFLVLKLSKYTQPSFLITKVDNNPLILATLIINKVV